MSSQENDLPRPLLDHLADLRSVLIRALVAILLGMAVALFYADSILNFLTVGMQAPRLVLLGPTEGFQVVLKVALWSGITLSLPYLFTLALSYLRPALKTKERRLAHLFILISTAFLIASAFFCFYLSLPLANQALLEFNRSLGENLWGLSSYIDFLLFMLFAHAITFEIGGALLFLIAVGVIPYKMLEGKRRHAIVFSLILGALLTPPDVLTQLLVAVPLYLFFEAAILAGKIKSGFDR